MYQALNYYFSRYLQHHFHQFPALFNLILFFDSNISPRSKVITNTERNVSLERGKIFESRAEKKINDEETSICTLFCVFGMDTLCATRNRKSFLC